MALTVTGTGGLAMLAGMLVLGHIVGSYDLDNVLIAGQQVRDHQLYLIALVLILLGALTKSAQFPFHFWLPHAMAAPTPVSAYLHSATMVKAGVFLLARMWPVLGDTDAWFWLVGGAGAATLLIGGYLAMFQHDLKGLLAYSTISHLGLITLLLGLNSKLAAVAAVFHIMNHATFKASLFMAAGIVDHESGTRDIRRLSGLRHMMPITATLACVASAAMAGVPLLNGFLSKEMFFAETVYLDAAPGCARPCRWPPRWRACSAWPIRCASPSTSSSAPRPPTCRTTRTSLRTGCACPSSCWCWPAWWWACCRRGPWAAFAAAATPVVGGDLPEYSLAIWHGWNMPLIMSLVALIGGILLYMLLRWQRQAGHMDTAPLVGTLSGQRVFENLLARLSLLGRWSRRRLSTMRLQWQMLWLVCTAVLAGVLPLWLQGIKLGDRSMLPLSPAFVMLWAVGILCALGTAWKAKYHRLTALIMLGGAGLCTCLTFLWFSAPDLALTQLVVEVATTVLMLLGLRWMPKRDKSLHIPVLSAELRARSRRMRDLLLSLVAGGGMAWLAFAMMSRPSMTGPPPSSWNMRSAMAAAPMWSTSCWWTSGASTPSARSWCWASWPWSSMRCSGAFARPARRWTCPSSSATCLATCRPICSIRATQAIRPWAT